MDLSSFNASHDFIDLANKHLGLNLQTGVKWQTCPACKGASRFTVDPKTNYYKCMKGATCELGKGGDIFSLFAWGGIPFKEALTLLDISSKPQYQVKSELDTLFDLYKSEYYKSNKAQEYVAKRYNFTDLNSLSSIDSIGFAPEGIESYGVKGERLVFPLRDNSGRIKHLHSRAIDPNEELRWLPTRTAEGEKSFGHYIWNSFIHRYTEHLFLCEGISDGLALSAIGLPTVALTSINVDFSLAILNSLYSLKTLVVLLDNDTMPSNATNGASVIYKSWDSTIDKLLLLKVKNPALNIICAMPPNKVGVKDVNDWLQVTKINADGVLHYSQHNGLNVIDFFIKHYWDSKKELHKLFFRACASNPNKYITLINQVLADKYLSPAHYLLEVLT
jgi:hypothetical protein